MSILSVYHSATPDIPNKVLTHLEDIAATLAEHGVRLERRAAEAPIRPGASLEEVSEAYRAQIDQLMTEHGCQTLEVISVDSDHPLKEQLRARLLDEQVSQANEARWFVAGRGLLTLHVEGYVYALLCERGDLVTVPAGMGHWFDMGEQPRLVVVRVFGEEAQYSGSQIASLFPRLDNC
ncbi:acireductone dioxygenase [Pseudomonas sp. TE3610]